MGNKTKSQHKRGRRILSGVLAAIMMLGTITDIGAATAFAKEPEPEGKATLTLTQSEHGKLSFSGAEGDTLVAEIGTSVTVAASPDADYYVEYIATIDADGVVEDLAVDDSNKATFEVKKPVEITASYELIKNKPKEAAEKAGDAKEQTFEMDVDESKDVSKAESVEDYILAHADKSKIGGEGKLALVDMMGIVHTFVDGSILPNATLDLLWGVDKDNDNQADNAGAFLSQSNDAILLYRMSENADYFVGKVGAGVSHAKVTDWMAGKNDMSGTTYDDIIYDAENHLVYVPNKYQTTDKDGKIVIFQTKLQLVHTVANTEKASANVDVTIDNDGVSGEITESGEASGTILSPVTEFELAKDEKAAENLASSDTIDSVIINGIEFKNDTAMWSYEETTRKLTINMSPSTVDTVEVKMSDGLIKGLKRFFSGFKAEAATDGHVGGEAWQFAKKPEVGDTWIAKSDGNYYHDVSLKPGYSTGLAPYDVWNSDTAAWTAFISAVCSGMGIDLSNLRPMDGSADDTYNGIQTTWTATIDKNVFGTIKNNTVTLPGGQQVNLACAHVGVDANVNYSPGSDMPGSGGADVIRITILGVDENDDKRGGTVWFSIVTPTVQSQAGAGAFKATWELEDEEPGKFRLKKFSAKPEYTNGNRCYNMDGVKYGVYTDRQCTDKIQTLTVKSNSGLTNWTKELDPGPYWVRELPESEWDSTVKGYKRNEDIKAISVTEDKNKTINLDGNMAEDIKNDPIALLVQKSLEDCAAAGITEGDVPSLKGVKFRVDYYNDKYSSAQRAKNSGEPTISAVFATDKDGVIRFDTGEPVDGTTWPFKTEKRVNGTTKLVNTFPYGTVLITEIDAPAGLVVNSAVPKAFTITENEDGSTKITILKDDQWPKQETDAVAGSFPNKVIKGKVVVYKAGAHDHTDNGEGDGSFEGIEYTIYNRSKKEITFGADKTKIPVGGEVAKIRSKTDEATGKVCASLDGLPYGTYQIVETKGNDSYQKANWAKTFSIRTDGQKVEYGSPETGWNEDEPTTGSIEIVKKDTDTGESKPQGNATLEGVEYTITNVSLKHVYWNNAWFNVGSEVAKIYTTYDAARDKYVARIDGLPYGTYKITETDAPKGYTRKNFETTRPVHEHLEVVEVENDDPVKRGGVSVTKADADWNTTNPQGDATLAGVTYNVINKSENAVTLPGSNKKYAPNEVVMRIRSAWDETAKAFVATTGNNVLPYGDYEIVEVESSVGYLNANWKKPFSIGEEGEMHCFDQPEDKPTVSGLKYHNRWNVNPVQRGGILVGKVDRETEQYLSLGEAHLDGAIFKIINRSENAVYVNGKTYGVGEDIMTITTKEIEHNGKKIYAATTGERVLPYGTYEIMEIGSGAGYLYDKESKAYIKTIEIRADGEMKELIDPNDGVVKNQVIREDFHFKKKQEDTMERMDNIPFLIESLTTGERHIAVTDENGTWHSTARDSENWAGILHTQRTNSNDPTSPISNGAIGVDENGEWYVKDASKLDCEAGIWFTGLPEDLTQWAADGKSYDVNGKNVKVRDDKRAFPYDTYRLQELRCPNNEGYGLIATTVTLHRYTADHDGVGIDIDYGTLDDKRLEIGTTLVNKENFGKVAPANSEVTLTDTVTYENLVIGKKYTMKGELHRVSKKEVDGEIVYTDEGVVAEAEKDFTPTKGSGRMTMDFKFHTDDMDKKFVVAFEYLMENRTVIATHEDLEDENQTVRIPNIKTTLQGDLGHMTNASKEDITLTDTITYENFEIGKEYVANGTLMKKVTDKDGKVTSEPVLDKDNKPITASTTFVALKENGTVDVVFKFSGVDMAGETIVAFENVTHNGVEYAVHADIEDENQTGIFPELDTFAVDGADGNKELAKADGQSIKDAVQLKNLEDGYEYKLAGELHVRNADGMDEGALMDKDGKPYVSEVTWEGKDKNQSMLFEGIDASKLGGKDIVVYQTLYGKKTDDKEWTLLGVHDDISDADQSVHVPDVGTTLVTGQEIHESQVPEDGMVTLKDVVTCSNLIPGHAYAVIGTLHIQDIAEDGTITDGGEVKNKRRPVTAKASFVATKAEETVEIEFTFDAHGLEGKSVTAFESLYSSPSADIPDEWKELIETKDEDANMDEPKDEWKVADHADITDMGQTVQFVDIKTTLTNNDGNHEAQVPSGEDKTITLTDVVAYHNLIPGREYTVTGTLHKQVVDKDGNITDGGVVTKTPVTNVTPGDATPDNAEQPVTATTTFVPATPDGEVEVIFTFDASGLEGKTVVAFEEISTDNVVFAVHADITDEPQSVHFVKIGTTALADNGLHEIQVPKGEDKTTTITDTVKYENLIPGTEYVMSGTLHIQSVAADGSITDGGTVNDKEGKPVVGTATFTPKEPNGTVDITFTFDASQLDGKTVVAFETVTKDGKFVASHEDITDEDQSVSFVDIHTTATVDGSHETQVPSGKNKTVTVTDRVEYSNLTPGTEYTMSGVLHKQKVDKKGNVTDGGEIKSTAKTITFTPETPNGFVELKFELDASELEGQTVVAFEELSKDGVTVAVHADITDESQSVHFVAIHTNAIAKNGTQMTQVTGDGKVTVTDRVTYENLIPGVAYKLSGTLHVQDADEKGNVKDGGIIKLSGSKDVVSADDGKAANSTVEKTFVPKSANGTEEITFTFDASKLAGKTVVAFEVLKRDDKVVATHEDINDEAQSVHFVRIRTKASAKNGKNTMELPDGETTKVSDLVEYKNLIPGLEYTMIGEFHVKSLNGKGKAADEGILADSKNKPIRAAVTFTPKKPDGSVTIDFEIPTKGLGNRTIVAFETLTYEKKVIATHADINDENQSITFVAKEKKPETPNKPVTPPETPNTVPADTPLEIVKTGQKPFYLIFAMFGVVLMAGGGYFYFRKKRK